MKNELKEQAQSVPFLHEEVYLKSNNAIFLKVNETRFVRFCLYDTNVIRLIAT